MARSLSALRQEKGEETSVRALQTFPVWLCRMARTQFSFGLIFTSRINTFPFPLQSQVSYDPKQQAKDKTRNSIPLPRKDY